MIHSIVYLMSFEVLGNAVGKNRFLFVFPNMYSRPGKVTLWSASYSAILKQLFTSVSVKVVDIYLAALRLGKCPPLFTSTSVNNC